MATPHLAVARGLVLAPGHPPVLCCPHLENGCPTARFGMPHKYMGYPDTVCGVSKMKRVLSSVLSAGSQMDWCSRTGRATVLRSTAASSVTMAPTDVDQPYTCTCTAMHCQPADQRHQAPPVLSWGCMAVLVRHRAATSCGATGSAALWSVVPQLHLKALQARRRCI